jgi:hypothetical protein
LWIRGMMCLFIILIIILTKKNIWNGVNIINCYDPEYLIGTHGQFIYDLNCIVNCRKYNFDIILQFGCTTSSIWSRIMPHKSILVANMNGIEWKRSKFIYDFMFIVM